MTDLSLIPTHALVNELAGRFDTMIFAGVLNRTEEEYDFCRRWEGDSMACEGLTRYLLRRINAVTDREIGEGAEP